MAQWDDLTMAEKRQRVRAENGDVLKAIAKCHGAKSEITVTKEQVDKATKAAYTELLVCGFPTLSYTSVGDIMVVGFKAAGFEVEE